MKFHNPYDIITTNNKGGDNVLSAQSETRMLLESYVQFASFLTNALGPHCGGVVFDMDESGLDGHVIGLSGNTGSRAMGDAMTPIVKQVLRSLRKEGYMELLHVDTEASTSEGRVKLCFYPIKKGKQIIGLFILCLEIDLLYDLREAINQLLGFRQPQESETKMMNVIDENLSLTQYMQQMIKEKIQSYSVPVERMSIEEKKQIVHELEKMEVFFGRDSARITASHLGISVPTLYRLLRQS